VLTGLAAAPPKRQVLLPSCPAWQSRASIPIWHQRQSRVMGALMSTGPRFPHSWCQLSLWPPVRGHRLAACPPSPPNLALQPECQNQNLKTQEAHVDIAEQEKTCQLCSWSPASLSTIGM
jgi:hypothetical protein